jgi:hypothetical protein
MTLSNTDRARLLVETVLKVDEELREEGRKTMDFALELEELINDYMSWGSGEGEDQRRADVIKALEEQLAILKAKND